MNKLFATLILEVVAVSIGFGYTGYLNADEPKSVVVNSKIEFVDEENNPVANISDAEFEEKLRIETTPNHTLKTLSGLSFMVYTKEDLPQITYSFPGYQSQTIDLELIKDSLVKNKINTGIVSLKRQIQNYDPNNFEPGTSPDLPDFFEGPPITTDSDDD